MTLIEDSRQQTGKHELKHARWAELNVPLTRCKLPVGDYARPPKIAVDTKASMQEIAQNIGGSKEEHTRFINELKLARSIDTKLFVLVENDEGIRRLQDVQGWHNPREKFSPNCIQGPRLYKAMQTIEERYKCTFLFCRPQEAADVILDLLK